MKRPIYTPKKLSPIQHEWSRYRTQRDNHSMLKQWKDESIYAKQLNSYAELIQQIQNGLQTLQSPTAGSMNLYPFRIYTVPQLFRPFTSSIHWNPNNNWRTVKIRNGSVLTSFVDPPSGSFRGASWVNGTDGVNWPDNDILPTPIDKGDILVPSGSKQYWFWIESTSTPTQSYTVRHGADPRTVSAGNPSPTWTNFPTASANNIPIGWVDAASSASILQLLTRQYLRTDVMAAGGGSGSYVTMSVCIDGSPQTWWFDAYPDSSSMGGP